MSIVGIIAEYNPFHNGHLYHINKTKELCPDATIILVLNGYFMQRGELSVLSKEDKTKIALEYGVDIVLELPFVFGTQSADIFAYKSIEILNHFGVDTIVFGSESNDIELLTKIADIQVNDKNYNERVKTYLDEGINYPTAMAKALNIKRDFNNPNDLLGISYIKAIMQINNKIKPITIKRTNDYHDKTGNDEVISASNIREKIKNNISIDSFVPTGIANSIIDVSGEKLFDLIKYKTISDHDLSRYLTVDEGIESRLIDSINRAETLDDLIMRVKTKRYTYNKIRRMLVHILVGFTKIHNNDLKLEYIKILGFNSTGQKYLNRFKNDIKIPISIITDSLQYQYELKATRIYDLINNTHCFEHEIKNRPIKEVS